MKIIGDVKHIHRQNAACGLDQSQVIKAVFVAGCSLPAAATSNGQLTFYTPLLI